MPACHYCAHTLLKVRGNRKDGDFSAEVVTQFGVLWSGMPSWYSHTHTHTHTHTSSQTRRSWLTWPRQGSSSEMPHITSRNPHLRENLCKVFRHDQKENLSVSVLHTCSGNPIGVTVKCSTMYTWLLWLLWFFFFFFADYFKNMLHRVLRKVVRIYTHTYICTHTVKSCTLWCWVALIDWMGSRLLTCRELYRGVHLLPLFSGYFQVIGYSHMAHKYTWYPPISNNFKMEHSLCTLEPNSSDSKGLFLALKSCAHLKM